MKLKKIIAAVLSAATVLTLAGCGKEATSPMDALNSNPGGTSSAANSKSSAANSTPSSPESSAPESSTPEEPEATNVLYAQGEKLDFPETPAEDFDYVLEYGCAYIKEYFGENSDVRIPEKIKGRRVKLDDNRYGFDDHGTIKRLIIPDGGSEFRFSSKSLESVTFLGDDDMNSKCDFYSPNLSSVYFCGAIPSGGAVR